MVFITLQSSIVGINFKSCCLAMKKSHFMRFFLIEIVGFEKTQVFLPNENHKQHEEDTLFPYGAGAFPNRIGRPTPRGFHQNQARHRSPSGIPPF